MTQSISINNQNFKLHPSGAVYWVERKWLLIADVHFGKIAHFRKNGAAIPTAATNENFDRLSRLLNSFETDRICFLGDLFHSSFNNEWIPFKAWVEETDSEILLISGNHDIIDPSRYEQLGVRVLPSLIIDDFLLTHHPTDSQGHFNFSGHVHPAVRLMGAGRQHLKLACFYKTSNQMILPAFGTFTGKHTLRPSASDQIFAIVDGEVLTLT